MGVSTKTSSPREIIRHACLTSDYVSRKICSAVEIARMEIGKLIVLIDSRVLPIRFGKAYGLNC